MKKWKSSSFPLSTGRKIFFGATGKIEDLIPSIVKHKTEKYFVPMSDVHNDDVDVYKRQVLSFGIADFLNYLTCDELEINVRFCFHFTR